MKIRSKIQVNPGISSLPEIERKYFSFFVNETRYSFASTQIPNHFQLLIDKVQSDLAILVTPWFS